MRDEKLYLLDIIEAINSIESFLANLGEDDFAANNLVQSAVLYKLSMIGEASSRISAEL